MTRIESLRKRLAAARVRPLDDGSVFIGDPQSPLDIEFLRHAPQDLRDLLETLDRIIQLTKSFYDRYESGQDSDAGRPSHVILRNIHHIAVHLLSERRVSTYDWTKETVEGDPLDSPVGDEGAKG